MKSAKVRKAVFAGSWYPSSASECEREINGFLVEGKNLTPPGRALVGGIVPHAGWYYSGSIACNVIHTLSRGTAPEVIMVFGMHLHPGSRNILMADGAWDTPLGPLTVDTPLAEALRRRFDLGRRQFLRPFQPFKL